MLNQNNAILNVMKKIIALFTAVAAMFVAVSCTTTNTDRSYDMAKKGQTVLSYHVGNPNAEAVRTAVLKSLQQRKWTVASTSFPITAKIENRGQLAFVSITYADGMLKFDTKGSKIGDNAYVPIRYVDFLMKTINKNVVLSTR